MSVRGLVLVVGPAPGVVSALEAASYRVEVIDHLDEVEGGTEALAVVLASPGRHVGLGELGPAVLVVVSSDDLVGGALERGAHDVLVEPIRPGEVVARVAAAARVTSLRAEVRELARTDPLSGLANRRFLDDHLAKVGSLARRLQKPFSLLMVDIDRMRRVNDDFGHVAGDQVLATVARRMMQGLRGEDVAGRWTGDVFVVLLPYTPVDGAWRLADRIRATVCDEPIPLGPDRQDDVVVTVSIGCSEGFGDDLDEHLRRAQAALDDAKAAGRNKVIAG